MKFVKLILPLDTSGSGCKAYPRIKCRRIWDFWIQLFSGKGCEMILRDVRKLSVDSGFQMVVRKVRRRRVKNWVRSADLQKMLFEVRVKNSAGSLVLWLQWMPS